MSKNEILKLFPEPVFKYHIEDSKNLFIELSYKDWKSNILSSTK